MKMNIKVLVFVVFSFIFLSSFPKNIEAQSGCCSHHNGVCGCSGGSQLCCDGSLSPSCTCYLPPPPAPIFPSNINATWNWSPNNNNTFDLIVNLTDPSPTQYSAVLNKCRGCDPGPKTDFVGQYFNFYNISPGTYYLNVKKEINGYWSNTVYWNIVVPAWYAPSPTPTPTPIIINSVNTQPPTNGSSIFTGLVLIAIGVFTIYIFYKGILWFIQYAKIHDWVYPTLFWVVLIGGIIIYFLVSYKPNKSVIITPTEKPKYTCNCSKTCPNMTCDEAYYQLNNCGCSKRDGNGDGIPCEAQCK